jgi:hypothetical protein
MTTFLNEGALRVGHPETIHAAATNRKKAWLLDSKPIGQLLARRICSRQWASGLISYELRANVTRR